MKVELKNDVLRKHNDYQGTFEKYQIVNGRRSWKTATSAIWFIPEFNNWAIGDLENIGTKTRVIASKTDFGDRMDDPSNKWDYWSTKDEEWQTIQSGDIIIRCNSGKYFQVLMYFHSN